MRLRYLENLHIPLWLLKDTSWMMHWRTFGTILIVPTISLACWIVWRSRKMKSVFIPNLAVLFWISANSTWMLGEFFHFSFQFYSLTLFLIGLGCMGLFAIRWIIKNKKTV